MLTNMRESIKKSKVLKFVLLLFICAPFAFFGINSYFGGGGASFAVKVNGSEVPVQVFEQEFNAQRNRLKQAFGGTIPQGFASDDLLRQQALESVITGEVLNHVIDKQKIVVSNQGLAKAITQTEVFQKDGRFDQERYEMQLRSAGYTVGSFESQFRRDVALQDLRDSIVSSNFVLPNEKQTAFTLKNQTRNASYIVFKLDPELENTEVDDAAVQIYYDENKENYKYPERVKIEYIELNTNLLKEGVDISEEDAKAYFEGHKDSYRVSEERSASHILSSLAEDADEAEAAEKLKVMEDLKARLDNGESFESLAKEFSEDPGSAQNGGSLGFFARGAMVPAFEEAAFSMEKGQVSEPIRSNFGYHIIRLDDIKEERGKDFAMVKDEIVDLLKQQQADEAFFEKNEILANQTYENPDSLVPAAEAGGFKIQKSDWIDRLSKDGIAANPKIINAALIPEVLDQRNNSQLIELGQNQVAVLRVLDHEDPRQRTFEEVAEEIKAQLKRESAVEQLQAKVRKSEESLRTGRLPTEVASESGGEYTEVGDIKRDNSEIERTIVEAVFSMPKPDAGSASFSSVSLPSGDQYVLVLNSVNPGEVPANTDTSNDPLIDPLQIGSAEYEAFVRGLRGKALVEINQQILQPEVQ